MCTIYHFKQTLFVFWTSKIRSHAIDTPKIAGESPKLTNICLQCTLKETSNYKLENGQFLLDQHYIYSYFGQTFVNTSQ